MVVRWWGLYENICIELEGTNHSVRRKTLGCKQFRKIKQYQGRRSEIGAKNVLYFSSRKMYHERREIEIKRKNR